MQINITSPNFEKNKTAKQLVDILEVDQKDLDLEKATLYYEFPLFKELDEGLEYPSFMIISPKHGIIIIQCDERTQRTISDEELSKLYSSTDQIYSFLFSKLIKIPNLRKSRKELIFDICTILYLPNYKNKKNVLNSYNDIVLVNNYSEIKNLMTKIRKVSISDTLISEVYSVIEGTRGIPKPKDRNITKATKNKKGGILEDLEREIAKFDKQQKIAALTQIDGPQRIRGLAGSGKTVVLAMKAALIHLRNHDA